MLAPIFFITYGLIYNYNNYMEVTLRFKTIDPWAKVTKYKDCQDYIAPYWTRSGNKYTGLTQEDAERLEKLCGYQEGYLQAHSEFWNTFAVKIGAKGLTLHTERPMEELQYLFLKGHKRVANGVSNVKPSHNYILTNRDAEAEEQNKLNKTKREAFAQFNKMSLDDMRKCLRLYGYKSDSMSNELIESKLFELVEKDPNTFFIKWIDNKVKETQYILETAVSKNIIRKNRTNYMYGTDMIGNSIDDAVAYLDNKKNQDIRLTIMSEIESK